MQTSEEEVIELEDAGHSVERSHRRLPNSRLFPLRVDKMVSCFLQVGGSHLRVDGNSADLAFCHFRTLCESPTRWAIRLRQVRAAPIIRQGAICALIVAFTSTLTDTAIGTEM